MRCIKAISQAKQVEWMRWESMELRKMGWQALESIEESTISFLIRSTYVVLPSPQNLNLWVEEDPFCSSCSSPATLRHILTGCKVVLRVEWYTEVTVRFIPRFLVRYDFGTMEEKAKQKYRRHCIF